MKTPPAPGVSARSVASAPAVQDSAAAIFRLRCRALSRTELASSKNSDIVSSDPANAARGLVSFNGSRCSHQSGRNSFGLAGLLATAEVTMMLALHPNLARLYSEAVARLHEELANPEFASEARSVLRSLIKTIMIRPAPPAGR